VCEALKYFPNHPKSKLVDRLYRENKFDEVREALSSFPTYESLLSTLVSKLKGKSVFTTLKKVAENKETDKYTKLKGLYSLSTHACIECENGNSEYKLVLHRLYEQIAHELYS
jgi:hypothetical protein